MRTICCMSYDILITGANRGLGLALTRILLDKGHRVFALNRGESGEIEQLRQIYPNRLLVFRLDLRNEAAIANAVNEISKHTDSLDISISNAAIQLESHRPEIEDTDFDAISQTFEVNSIVPLKLAKHVLPLLLKGKKKLLVSISSEAGSITACWRTSEYGYTMSKAALNMQSRILQNRYAKENLKVLAIHPGWVRTDMGGPQAHLSPEESATAIATLVLKSWSIDGPVYVDHEGQEMAW